MKKIGSVQDFTAQRNAELMHLYLNYLKSHSSIIRKDIIKAVAESPASRFWISEERAAIVIGRMIAGKPLPRMISNKREMFQEIYRRYLIMASENPGKSISALVAEIVHQPAPKFYLTPTSVGVFIYRVRKQRRQKKFQNIVKKP